MDPYFKPHIRNVLTTHNYKKQNFKSEDNKTGKYLLLNQIQECFLNKLQKAKPNGKYTHIEFVKIIYTVRQIGREVDKSSIKNIRQRIIITENIQRNSLHQTK